jgi:hypothetical protein
LVFLTTLSSLKHGEYAHAGNTNGSVCFNTVLKTIVNTYKNSY